MPRPTMNRLLARPIAKPCLWDDKPGFWAITNAPLGREAFPYRTREEMNDERSKPEMNRFNYSAISSGIATVSTVS